jgi:phenylpropionate dioxygenase-like ring-hydroxylating dioxygenase large terminal subunit
LKKGGIIWIFMGSPNQQPELPDYEFTQGPPTRRFISKRLQECNWLQALEGGIDSSHVSWLHGQNLNSDPLFAGSKGNKYNFGDLKPRV